MKISHFSHIIRKVMLCLGLLCSYTYLAAQTWHETQVIDLLATFGTAEINYVIADDVLVIASPKATVQGLANAGKVFIYSKNTNGIWTQVGEMISPTPTANENFGTYLAFENNNLVIHSSNKIYLYNKVGSSFISSGTINRNNNQFLTSTSMNENFLFVLDTGSKIDIYRKNNNIWELSKEISITGAHFSYGLLSDNNTFFINQRTSNYNLADFQIFQFDGSEWNEEEITFPNDSLINCEFFGSTFNIKGDTLVIGSAGREGGDNICSNGRIFFYRKNNANIWEVIDLIDLNNTSQYNSLILPFDSHIVFIQNVLSTVLYERGYDLYLIYLKNDGNSWNFLSNSFVGGYFAEYIEIYDGNTVLSFENYSANFYIKELVGDNFINQFSYFRNPYPLGNNDISSYYDEAYLSSYPQIRNNIIVNQLSGSINTSQSQTPYNKLIIFEKSDSINLIKGKVYADFNENCIKDSTEVAAGAGFQIKAESGNFITTTNEAGEYTLPVKLGNYTLTVTPLNPNLSNIGACTLNPINFSTYGNTIQNYDFGIDVPLNQIQGKVFLSENFTCEADTAMAGIQVKAEPGNHLTTTDSLGNYQFDLAPGNYTISVLLPELEEPYFYNPLCPSTNQVAFNYNSLGFSDTLNFYFSKNTVTDGCTNAQVNNYYGKWFDATIPNAYNNNSSSGNQLNLIPNCLTNEENTSTSALRKDAWLKFTAPNGYSQMLIQVDNSLSPNHNIGITVNTDCELSMIACVNDVRTGIESVAVPIIPNQTYWVRILDLNQSGVSNIDFKGKIRLTPIRPLVLGPELVKDGDFAEWQAVNLNPANLSQTLPRYARFASYYVYAPDRTNVNNQFLPRLPEYEAQLLTRTDELNLLEGRFSIGKTARTLFNSRFSFGAGYTGYGGGTSTLNPNYCNNPNQTNSDACEGFGSIQTGQALPTPTLDKANFMLVNGSYDPNVNNLPASNKIWCQTLPVESGEYYYLSAEVNNLISAGGALDLPFLRFTVCATETLPGTTLIQDTLTVHNPPLTFTSQYNPTGYGAATACGTNNANLIALPSDMFIKERQDDWRLMSNVFRVPAGITQINFCIENISLTKNGNDFGLDKISFRKIEMPAEAFLDNITCALVQPESVPESPVNIVRGKVYEDKDLNCAFNQGDSTYTGVFVRADPGPYYAHTDNEGNYALRLPAGTYTINQIIPKNNFDEPFWDNHCPENDTFTVNLAGANEEIVGNDFVFKRNNCIQLKVDVSSNRRLRCFESSTTITYKNEGNVTAENARIEIKLPNFVRAKSSSIPWQSYQNGKIVYQLGNLAPNQGGQIVLKDSTACTVNNNLGTEQCTEARIFPSSNCSQPSPNWNQASLTLQGECLILFDPVALISLKNAGIGNMTDSTAFRIFANAELIYEGKVKLNKGDSLAFEIPTQGMSIRVEADQVAFHPSNRQVSVSVEGCGLANDTVSTGFVNQLPQNDDADEFEVDCMPVTGSFDPNDKQVSPIGITENHYVKPDTRLEYTIRFQNTGNAPAFNIYVIDTLSERLAIETFEVMSLSHPAQLSVSGLGKPILRWDFRDINLPDSTSNEPESHGFIKFKISPKAGLPEGTIVENFGDIYFDFNEPIRTNTTVSNFTDYQFPVSTTINKCDIAGVAPKKPSIAVTILDTLRSSETGEKYEWFFNGTALSFNTRSIKANESGNYEVRISKNGCVSAKSAIFAYTITALNEFERLSKVQVFPNPTQGKLQIRMENPLDKTVTLTLSNAIGTVVWQRTYKTNTQDEWKEELNLSRFGKGLYFLQIQNSKGFSVKKVMIE